MKSLIIFALLMMGTTSALAYNPTECFRMGIDKGYRTDWIRSDKANLHLDRSSLRINRIRGNEAAIRSFQSICRVGKLYQCLYLGEQAHTNLMRANTMQKSVHLNRGLKTQITALNTRNKEIAGWCAYNPKFIY